MNNSDNTQQTEPESKSEQTQTHDLNLNPAVSWSEIKTQFQKDTSQENISQKSAIEILKCIKNKYKHYIDCENPLYVYKMCTSFNNNNGKLEKNEWLVIMKKLPDTVTNESRKNAFNCKYAKYRANKLEVIEIINVKNLQT